MTEAVESDLSRAFKIVAVLKLTELYVLRRHFKDKLHDGMFFFYDSFKCTAP